MIPVVLQYDAITRSFAALSVKGLDEPDDVRLVGVQHEYRNGVIAEQLQGFQRVITLDLGVLTDKDDRFFLLKFLTSSNRQLRTSSQLSFVSLVDPERFANEWMDDIEHGRRFTLSLIDEQVYRVFPTIALETEIMYLKSKVEITGTQASPESFTTNSGKLATDETGNAYPTFNAATHVVHVSVNGAPYQEAHVNIIEKPAVSSGNISFQLAVQDGGKPASDGKFYADISIFLQAKP